MKKGTLTPQEAEVLRLTAYGLSQAEISKRLRISARTVHRRLHSAEVKMKAGNAVQAALRAHRQGLIELRREGILKRPLRPLEREAINLLVRGESVRGVALRLSLHEITVSHRLTTARYALNAPSMSWVALAVRAALFGEADPEGAS